MANNKTDYTKPHTDLVELLPEPLRSDVNLSLFNNVFNRYLTKLEIEKVAGYIGRGNTAAIRPRQIHEQDVHRQAYQLQPIPYNKIGTIEHMTSWKDMQNELERLGVDMDAFSEWGATEKFNWVPPIDINKIINYRDYYWVDPENPNSIPQYITIRSTCATATAKFNFWDSLIEQHGSTFQISEISASDATPLTYTITEFIDTPDSIKIEGDVTTDILLGDFIDVVGSVNNDETYRITATPTYSGVTNETLLLVDGTIIAEGSPTATPLVSSRRFDKLVLPANSTLVGSPPTLVFDLGNYTSLFVEGFIFFIRNSTNVDLNSTFIETISSTYDADKKETTVVINHRVTDDTADGEISLEEQVSVLEADMLCQCDEFGGWDTTPWDDNPREPLWGDSEDADGNLVPDGISDHENLITRISNAGAPVSDTGVEGELWYDTTTNILYQNSASPLTVTRTETFVASGSPVGTVFAINSIISTDTIATAKIIGGGSPVDLNISYTADGTDASKLVTVLDSLSTNDIIEITYETAVWTVVWRNFSLILEQTTGISLWDLSLSCDTRPRITATEQWIEQNKWFHKNDVVNFTSVQRANQPIIEYDWDVELNEWTYVNYNWSYRRIITETFAVTAISPARIELEPLTWWEQTDTTAVDNTIILDDRYGDLTDYFVEGRTVFLVDGLSKTTYTVVSSSYKTAEAIPSSGEFVFPYRTYITFDKTIIGVGSPIVINNLSQQRPNAISIIPVTTIQGDGWKDYGVHWLFTGADDATPVPHQVLNPFMDIDVTQTPIAYPPVAAGSPPPAVGSPPAGSPPAVIGSPPNVFPSWDISTASFPTMPVVESPNLPEEFGIAAFTFGDSGTKMYVTGNSQDRVFQYTLTPAYDVTSAVFAAQSPDHSAQHESATGVKFDPTGTKMFMVAAQESFVSEWSLSSAWDVTSASHTGNGAIATNGNSAMYFKEDGLTLYVIVSPPFSAIGSVYRYSLGVAWTVSSINATPVTITDISVLDDEPNGITISPDGTKMHIVGEENDQIYQYTLSTPFDVDSLSLDLEFDNTNESARMQDIEFGPGGFEMYTIAFSSHKAYEYTLVDAYDMSTSTQQTYKLLDTNPTGVSFDTTGDNMFVSGDSSKLVRRYSLGTSWDITTASFLNSYSFTDDTSLVDVQFKSDGTKMYVLGYTGTTTVFQYALSPAWDITTAGTPEVVSTLITSTEDTGPRGMSISTDGTRVFVIGLENNTVYQYNLGTAWDMSSASYSTFFVDVSALSGTTSRDVAFNTDGTAMYVFGSSNDTIFQYELNTAWDLSDTVTYTTQFYNVSGEDSNPTGLYWNPDGLQVILVGTTTDSVRTYDIDPL